jgi:hypothetical protein
VQSSPYFSDRMRSNGSRLHEGSVRGQKSPKIVRSEKSLQVQGQGLTRKQSQPHAALAAFIAPAPLAFQEVPQGGLNASLQETPRGTTCLPIWPAHCGVCS